MPLLCFCGILLGLRVLGSQLGRCDERNMFVWRCFQMSFVFHNACEELWLRSHVWLRRSKTFGRVVLESIGVKSSCIAAPLVLSTTSAMAPDPNYGLVWYDFKTACGKVYNGIIDESTRFQFFKGHVGLPTTQRPRIFFCTGEGG